MKPELELAARLADEYIASFDTHRVTEEPDPQALRARLHKRLPAEGLSAVQVIGELHDDARPGLLNTAGGRFFGWVIGGGVPVAVAADWLTSAWDQNAAAHACSPSGFSSWRHTSIPSSARSAYIVLPDAKNTRCSPATFAVAADATI